MSLNEDILNVVTRYADAPTLAIICRLSRATRRLATMLLYRSVRVRRLDELSALDNALAKNETLGPLVLEFFQDLSRDTIPPRNDPHTQRLGEQFTRCFDGALSRILPLMVNLEAAALENIESSREEILDQLSIALAALPRLRSVRLPGFGSANLVRVGALAGLEHISIKHCILDLIAHWFVGHAATLQALRIDNSGMSFRRLALASQTTVFPHLHTLALPTERLPLAPVCAMMFPGLLSLSIFRPERNLPHMWPRLQYLSFTMTDDDPIAPLPYVASLQLSYTGTDIGKLAQLHKWSAHHVRALVLSCSNCGFAAHFDALRIYNRLRMFDVHLPSSDNDVAEWMWRARRLPVVPSALEVLTVRNAGGIDGLTEETVNGLRLRTPSLKLVRVISVDGRQPRAYGWPAPLDWRGACEMVADYLPHWRDTRAPWDDICDL